MAFLKRLALVTAAVLLLLAYIYSDSPAKLLTTTGHPPTTHQPQQETP